MIPDDAVEAAARAMFDVRDDPYDMDEWEDVDSTEREPFVCQARAALEAAAPHMIAAHLLTLAEDTRARGDIGKDGGCEAWDYLTFRAEKALHQPV